MTQCPHHPRQQPSLCKGEQAAQGHNPGVTPTGTGEAWPINPQPDLSGCLFLDTEQLAMNLRTQGLLHWLCSNHQAPT